MKLHIEAEDAMLNRMSSTGTLLVMLTLSQASLGQTYDPMCWIPTNVLWRVKDNTDYMTTANGSERNAYPSSGQIFYVPSNNNLSNTGTLWRLYQSSIPDHMESVQCTEGNYSCESILGYPWTPSAPAAGTAQIVRVYNGFDHATIRPGETLSGYNTTEGLAELAYPRYNSANEVLSTIWGGGVQVDSNLAAGGAIWNWTYQGVEYINHHDHGRLLQTAFLYNTLDRPSPCNTDKTNFYTNPTEAGDATSTACSNSDDYHGSPLVSVAITGGGTTQSTRAVPVDFNHFDANGGVDCSYGPRVFKDMIVGKDITLPFAGMQGVAKYVTTVTLPEPLGSSESIQLEVPTAYLNGKFSAFYVYDGVAGLTSVNVPYTQPPATPQPYKYTPPSGYGAAVIADTTDSGDPAMAIFATTSVANQFHLYNFIAHPAGPNGPNDDNTSKMTAYNLPAGVPAGTSTYTTWVISGPLLTVYSQLGTLYQHCITHEACSAIFDEDFETDLRRWVATGSQLSVVQSRSGHSSYKVTNDLDYLVRTLGSNYNAVAVVWFYDDATDVSEMVSAFVDDGVTAVGIGVDTPLSTNNYVYRFGNVWTPTAVPRSTGWHQLVWDYRSGNGVVLYVDGSSIASSAAPTTFNSIQLGDAWADGRTATAYYDDVLIQNSLPSTYFGEGFETDLSNWSYPGSPSITSSLHHSGTSSYGTSNDLDYITRYLGQPLQKVAVVWFYDNSSNTSEMVAGFVNDSVNTAGIGVYTGLSASKYVYRFGNTWSASSITRSTGWHQFVWDYRSGSGVSLYIDGTLTATSVLMTNFSEIQLGDFWADGKVASAYFDDVAVQDSLPF